MEPRDANRLANASSPYLRHHADNPVDWYPWGPEAFERARELDRPVFLSVGYAACHWCHVMERESFLDPEIAALLNGRFVSVKVDREERPDIDALYMDAVQTMSGHGGWPMSVWLTPDGRPFYAGTYFPDEPRHGMPSFRQVVEALAVAWEGQRDDVEVQAMDVLQALSRGGDPVTTAWQPEPEIRDRAAKAIARTFDGRWGGFGGAPKFPQPMVLEFLLRRAAAGDDDARRMVTRTLDRMIDGGIHDQVGGGFARYSTDVAWHVPHFEKMLSDNAQMALIATHAWLLTREARYRDVATRSLDYALREVQHPLGAFFSSQDADSEGIEGRYYVWTWDDLAELVGERLAKVFGAAPLGNWPEGGPGVNVLWHPVPLADAARGAGLEPRDLEDEVRAARATLLRARSSRPTPATDDKILTAWNALQVRALAEAGRAFGEPRYVDEAVRCGDFLWHNLRDEYGRLLRSWRDGTSGPLGFADDHALLAGAFLTLFETTGNVTWFARARELADALIELFLDVEGGGFFIAGRDAEPLLLRQRDLQDNATPSGNSAAAETLIRLSLLTGEGSYEVAGMSALMAVGPMFERAPLAFGSALGALDLAQGPPFEIAVVGRREDPATQLLLDVVFRDRFAPNAVLAHAPPGDVRAARAVPLLAGRVDVGGRPAAYVCRRFVCLAPVTSPEALASALDAG